MSILFHFTQSKLDKDSHVAVKNNLFYLGVANEYLSRVLNTIITDKIVMMKIT